MKILIINTFILFLITLSNQVYAQGAKTTLKIGGSAISYKGDMAPSFSDWQGAVRAEINFNAHQEFNWGANVWYGQVAAGSSDLLPSETAPNTRFVNVRTDLMSAELFVGYQKYITKKWRAYVRIGMGGIKYDPVGDTYEELTNDKIVREIDINLRDHELTRNENEDYGRYAFSLPLGIGMSYILPNGFGIDTQFRYLNPFTDYLDNASELGGADGNDKLMEWNISLIIPIKYLSKSENSRYQQKLRKNTLIKRR